MISLLYDIDMSSERQNVFAAVRHVQITAKFYLVTYFTIDFPYQIFEFM